jgi:two-component system response regulator YesN
LRRGRRKRKLLIADGEGNIRRGTAKYIALHTDRFEKICEAANGQEAIDCILQHLPDLVLLDVQMPGKNGIDVMREAEEAGAAPVFAILSGYDEFAYAQQALRYGAKEYLLKPVRAADILACPNRLADLYCEEEKKPPAPDGGTTAERLTARAKEVVSEHYMERLSLSVVAEKIGCSDNYLSTIFSQEAGCGFVDYLNRFRVERACLYLQQRTLKTYEIAYRVGFQDEKYFARVFRKVMGVSPKQYAEGKTGEPSGGVPAESS